MADLTLGRLTKWLRMAGYDVLFYRGAADRNFLNAARKESRIALTRKAIGPRQYTGTLLVVDSDVPDRQIAEVVGRLRLKPDPAAFFSRCLKCNRELKRMDREDAEGAVPRYVFESGKSFRSCPDCGKIYWRGTHIGHALALLRKRIPPDRP